MTTILSTHKHIARKQYTCNACEWISEWIEGPGLWDYEFTCAELREIVKARRNAWCIMPGQEYIREVGIHDGELIVWRGLPAINAICRKYDIYEYA